MQIRIRKLLVVFLGVCMLLLVIGETGAAPANVLVHTGLINVYGVDVEIVNLSGAAPRNPYNIIAPDYMLNINHGVINTGTYWDGDEGIYVRVQYNLINDNNYTWSTFDAEFDDKWKPGKDEAGNTCYYYTEPILANPDPNNPTIIKILKDRSGGNGPYHTMYVPQEWTKENIPSPGSVSVSATVQAVQARNFSVDFNSPDGLFWRDPISF